MNVRRVLSALDLLRSEVTAEVGGDGPVVPAEEPPVEEPRASPDLAAGGVPLLRGEGLGEVDPVDPAVVADQGVLVVPAVVVDEGLEHDEVGHGPFEGLGVRRHGLLLPEIGHGPGVGDEGLEGPRHILDGPLDDRRDVSEAEVLVQRVGGQVVLEAVGERVGPAPVDVPEQGVENDPPRFEGQPPGVGPAAGPGAARR